MEALNLKNEFETRSYLRQTWTELRNLKLANIPTPIIFRFPTNKHCFLSWLKSNSNYPCFYFRTRNREQELAGKGSYRAYDSQAIKINDWNELIETHPQSNLLHLFFCQNFSNKETWGEFSHMQYLLPQVFCERVADNYFQTFILPLEQISSVAELERQFFLLAKSSQHSEHEILDADLPKLSNRKDLPDLENWKKYLNTILKHIAQGKLKKVVPARRTDYQLSGKCDVFSLLNQLMLLKQNVYNYLYSPKAGQYFLGGTPERLFSYTKGTIKTEALAGTIALAGDNQELYNEKNMLEHNLVVEGLKERLRKLGCTNILSSTSDIMPLANMQHLRSRMEAKAGKQLTLEQIVSCLHPTAAVCGEPQDIAASLINELEPFTRGLYAGPVGVANKESIECAVALRSCLIQDKRISLFAGAGVVAGSEPEKEWAELNTKIATLEQLFRKNEE